MTQQELNREIARRTGEDIHTINRLGFSLMEAVPNQQEWEDQAVDWDQHTPDSHRLQWFRHRRQYRSGV